MNDDELVFASYFTNQTYNDTNKYSYNPITTNDNNYCMQHSLSNSPMFGDYCHATCWNRYVFQ